MSDRRQQIRQYILDNFLPGEDPANLADETPLVTAGILDSLATMMLVSWLEESFGIEVAAHEASVDNLDTIDLIDGLVERKRPGPV